MIKAIKIEMERAEGPKNLCKGKEAFTQNPWMDANAWLIANSSTAPKSGGYDKCDFYVHFEDGYVYEGRIDIKHYTCEKVETVAGHIRQFFGFYLHDKAYRPSHLTDRQWEDWGKNPTRIENSKGMAEFLEEYEIPER